MTCHILFSNGCGTYVCTRYSDVLNGVYTTTAILQKYLDDHKQVEWISHFKDVKDFANSIIGSEAPLTIIDGKWNEGGWQEGKDFFENKTVKTVDCVNLNWNWR